MCTWNLYFSIITVLCAFSRALSCSEEEEQTPLAIVGSPYWMAPEMLRGEVYNEKVMECWSLACTKEIVETKVQRSD